MVMGKDIVKSHRYFYFLLSAMVIPKTCWPVRSCNARSGLMTAAALFSSEDEQTKHKHGVSSSNQRDGPLSPLHMSQMVGEPQNPLCFVF
ncbi:unnamed protein product [Arctogadus glacialis]